MDAITPNAVIVVECAEEYQKVIDELEPVETLEEAKAAVIAAGYDLMDSDDGGDCRRYDGAGPDGDDTWWLITVYPD